MDDNVVLVGFTDQSKAYQALSQLRQADVAGRVEVELRAPYADVVRLALHPGEGLLVEPGVWAAQTYETADSALMVLASGPYDADELFHEPPDA